MKDHLDAIAALVQPEDIPCHLLAAPPNTLPPYLVLAPRTPSALADSPVAATDPPLDCDVLVTTVAGTPGGALDLLIRVRARLAPAGGPSFPSVSGRFVQLDWLRFEVADVDTSVKIPTTNRNPAYAADSYSLASEPTS